MAVKTTGHDWNLFYADKTAWPDGAWHEDEELLIDGSPVTDDQDLSALPPAASVRVSGGVVYLGEFDREGPSVESHLRKWLKQKATIVMVVEMPKESAEAVRTAIEAAGGKVVA